MSFVKQSVFRSCFGTRKHIGGISLKSDIFLPDTNMYDFSSDSLTVSQKDGALIIDNLTSAKGTASCRLTAYPGPCLVELSVLPCFRSTCGLSVGSLSFVYDGRTVKACAGEETVSSLPVGSGALLLHFNGSLVSLCTRSKKGIVDYAGTFDLTEYEDLREYNPCRFFSLDFTAEPGGRTVLTGADVYMTGGTGQADFRIVSYEDGTPVVDRGRVYLAASCRGYEKIPCSCQAVYSMPAEGGPLEIEGIVTFDKGDNICRCWHASHIYYDRNADMWTCVTVSHGDDHGLYYARTKKDIRFGYSVLDALPVDYDRQGNEEDPYLLTKDGSLYMLYVKAGENGYRLVLARAEALEGHFEDIATVDKTSFTGPILLNIGGELIAAAGRGVDNFEVYRGEALAEAGCLEPDSRPHARNVWPCIWPFDDGRSVRAAMLTFDRGKITGSYSYGACYLYHSTEKFENFCKKN